MSDKAIYTMTGRAQRAEDAIREAERNATECLSGLLAEGERARVISAQLVLDGGGSIYSPSWLYVITLVHED